MKYRSVGDTAESWGVTPRQVQRLLHAQRIPGAHKYGAAWMIPQDAVKPEDARRSRKRGGTPEARMPMSVCPMLAMTPVYARPGGAAEALRALAGAPEAQALFRAQLARLRGEAERAETLAGTLLLRTQSPWVRLGCLFTRANAALYTGDCEAWRTARAEAEQTHCRGEARIVGEICLAAVDSALYDRRSYPDWLRIGCFDGLPAELFPAARYYFAKYLAISRSGFQTVEMLEPLCSQSRADGAVAAEIYLRLIAATGYHDCGNRPRAAYHIARAIELALPDRLYAPLAEARKNIGMQLDEMLYARSPEAMRAVDALWNRLMPAWTTLYQARMGRAFSSALTLRELETVKFAAVGLTNSEIALRMGLSTGTVKNYISTALQKTGLQDRSAFADYLSLS